MVQSVDKTYEIAFDANVKKDYQGQAFLRNYVYTKGNVVGDRIKFRKVGSVLANEHNAYSDMTYSDPQYGQVEAVFKDWECALLIDKPQTHNFTYDEAVIDSEIVAEAVARRLNQTIIDALAKTITPELGQASSKLTVATLQKAKRYFDQKGVPGSERYFLHTAQQMEQLMSETKATSSDYVNVKALVEGNIKNFLGFNFVLVPDMKEGGLPTGEDSGNYEKGFIIHKRSIGFGVPKEGEITTSKDWLPQKQSWQVCATLSCGSVIIDDVGVLPIKTINE